MNYAEPVLGNVRRHACPGGLAQTVLYTEIHHRLSGQDA